MMWEIYRNDVASRLFFYFNEKGHVIYLQHMSSLSLQLYHVLFVYFLQTLVLLFDTICIYTT